MKKIAPIAALALVVVAFTSCKKDYTCTCKNKDGKTTMTYPLNKAKKSDATTACDAWNNAAKISGGSCSL